ncbi:MAG: hypothetical protein LBJ97_03040 [Mycoplasmataceae bacterium]|jgi:hypothetical protein|nr:hypothetical protein [Mycoplasmataceae bacterium]
MKKKEYEVVTIKVGGWTFWGNANKTSRIIQEYLSEGWELVHENKQTAYVGGSNGNPGFGGSATKSLTFRREK